MPRVSVVIPCRNGAAVLHQQLDALASQACSTSFEVIVADNASTDSTRSIVLARSTVDPRFRLVDASARRGVNHARNVGIGSALGELILVCDADDAVRAGWVEAYWSEYVRGMDLGGGKCWKQEDGQLTGEAVGIRYTDLLPYPTGANFALSRRAWQRFGPFDEGIMGGGDEAEFFWRAQLGGLPLVDVPAAEIDYAQRTRVADCFRQAWGYGMGSVVLYQRFARAGMTRPKLLPQVARAVLWTLVFAATPWQARRRRRMAREVGAALGRAVATARLRAWQASGALG